MAQDLFQYDKMVEAALRGVVRDALSRAARDGLRGAHHFYIGFATQAAGVDIPDYLHARYPEEMTIVLQHQFWDLEVTDDSFAVTLSFQKQLERLVVPLAAVRSFADPSVNFALEFAAPEGAAAPADKPAPKSAVPAPLTAPAKPDKPAEKPEKPASAEVVALDSFRKR
jgi:hypothetical protein